VEEYLPRREITEYGDGQAAQLIAAALADHVDS
jgi:hypothetical protein